MNSDGTATLQFDSSNPEFRRGFEAGLVWSHAYNAGGVDAIIHADNAEMMLRICECLGMPWRVKEVNEDFIHITLGRALARDQDD